MYGAFIDDSGSHTQSPLMILAALVARKKQWDNFSDEWQAGLDADGRIDYFKSYEAITLTGCFEGLTRKEATAKTDMLTDITLKHIFYGMLSAVHWRDFAEIIQGSGVRPKGQMKYFVRHPYFICFHDVISCVGQAHMNLRNYGKVDFMFDNQGKWGDRCIRLFNELKPNMPQPLRDVLGEAHQGDDKVYLPLQAADLIAWQMRNKNLVAGKLSTRSYAKIVNAHNVGYHTIKRAELKEFIRRQPLTLLPNG